MQSFFNSVRYKQEFAVFRLEHAFCDAVIKEAEKFVVEAINIE